MENNLIKDHKNWIKNCVLEGLMIVNHVPTRRGNDIPLLSREKWDISRKAVQSKLIEAIYIMMSREREREREGEREERKKAPFL